MLACLKILILYRVWREGVHVASGSLIFQANKACLFLGGLKHTSRWLNIHFHLHCQVTVNNESSIWREKLSMFCKRAKSPITPSVLKLFISICGNKKTRVSHQTKYLEWESTSKNLDLKQWTDFLKWHTTSDTLSWCTLQKENTNHSNRSWVSHLKCRKPNSMMCSVTTDVTTLP